MKDFYEASRSQTRLKRRVSLIYIEFEHEWMSLGLLTVMRRKLEKIRLNHFGHNFLHSYNLLQSHTKIHYHSTRRIDAFLPAWLATVTHIRRLECRAKRWLRRESVSGARGLRQSSASYQVITIISFKYVQSQKLWDRKVDLRAEFEWFYDITSMATLWSYTRWSVRT